MDRYLENSMRATNEWKEYAMKLANKESSSAPACSIADILQYIRMRKEQTECHIQTETLSGNTVKRQIEEAVLAELNGIEQDIIKLQRQ